MEEKEIPFLRTKGKFDRFEGFLYKKGGHFSKTWRKRQFILDEKGLHCYDIELNKLKKIFELNNHAKIERGDTDDDMFVFTITYDDKNDSDSIVYLASKDSDDRELWINGMLESQRGGPVLHLYQKMNENLFDSFIPEIDMLVTYRNTENIMNDGNEVIIDPEKMYFKPIVAYKPMSLHDVFSIVYIDSILSPNSDIPQRVLWMIVDIKGSDLTSGTEVLSYMRPVAPNNEEVHRYTLLLIKQSALLTPSHFHQIKSTFSTRDAGSTQFSTFKIYVDNPKPSAIAVFRCIWNEDNIVNSVKIDNFFYGIMLRKQTSDDYFSKKRLVKIDSLKNRICWSKSLDLCNAKFMELNGAIIINDTKFTLQILCKNKKSIKLFFDNNVDKNVWFEKVKALISTM